MAKNKQQKVLVVDNDSSIRDMLSDILIDEGYHVRTASDGLQAIRSMKKEMPDLLLTDVKMPGMNGLDLITRAREIHPEVLTIIMTGFATLDTARHAIRKGACDYLLKPFNVVEIGLSVRNAFERKALHDENMRLKDLTGLFEVSKVINATILTQDVLFENIIDAALLQTGSNKGCIVLCEEENDNKFEVVISSKLSEKDKVCLNKAVAGQKFVASARQEKEAFIISSEPNAGEQAFSKAKKNPRDVFLDAMFKRSSEMAVMPIWVHKNFLGLIALMKEPDRFTVSELHILTILANQAAVAIENSRLFKCLRDAYLSMIESLILILEAKDAYTHGHTRRVTDLSLKIGEVMGIQGADLDVLETAALVHDIGKVGVSETVLNKVGAMSSDEQQSIERHPLIGDEILKPIKYFEKVREIVKHHHERPDGKGYPDGLDYKRLNVFMNIIHVADAFDAMNSHRAYRRALAKKEILHEFKRNKGTQFDSRIVEVLFDLVAKGNVKFTNKAEG